MGGGGGKGGGGSTVQQVQIPPEVLARYNAVNAKAETVAATPFEKYTGEFVAPLNATQTAGINATSNASQMAQPYYQDATSATKAGMQNVGPLTAAQIQQYQNPYTQAVVDPTVRALQQQQGMQLSDQQSQAIRGGAFGGDRAGLNRAQLQGQQNLALGQAIAPLYQAGYNTAVQTAMGQQGVVAADLARQLAGGQQLANLGSAAQNAALTGAQAKIAAGTLPQQTQQAEDTAKYQQFQQEKGYPFQTTQFLANIAEGTGALSGNTTTQQQGGGFFSSDARLKENIEPVGELFDGQKVYRYNFKDDPDKKTQIGIIAQEAAAKRKPGLGIDDDGFLAVNYRDVTDEAAEAGKGLVPNSMGGAVRSAGAYARGGYAVGGGGADFGSLVAAHRAMYDDGKKKEAGLNIPAAASAPKSLSVPPMMKPEKQPNAAEQAMKTGQGIAQTGEAISKISKMSPIQGTREWFGETFGGGKGDKLGIASRADSTPGASGPAAQQKGVVPGKQASAAPPVADKLDAPTSNRLALGPEIREMGVEKTPISQPGLGGQRYADSGQTMNDAGRQPYLPDANNNVDVAYSGQAYDLPQTGAKAPLQDIQAQNAAFQGADGGADLSTAANESLGNLGDGEMDFASSLDSLGDFANVGSDLMDVADAGSGIDELGSLALDFAKRGGRIGPYAKGGLVPRHGYAVKGFVTPGYDTEHNPDDIMDTVVEEGEQSPQQLQSEEKATNPPMHSNSSGGGGNDGFNPMSAIGPAISLIGMFSDARLKKHIEPVGKTYDGQNIYRYDFGDGKTQLGLIAQEVAKHKPEAVGKKNGYLTVDYKQATKDASPFAYGGLVPREHHNGNDGDNVVGDNATTVVEQSPRLSREDLSAEAEPTGLDTRLVATASDKPFKIDPIKLEDMPEHRQALVRSIYGPESGGRYDVRYGGVDSTGKTFDPNGPHPNIPELRKDGRKSTAAGAGQFIKGTWDEVTGGAPMTQGYQDNATWTLAQRNYNKNTGRDLDTDLKEKGVTPDIKAALAPTWEALSKGATSQASAPERGLGSFLSGKSGKGMYNGVSSENAGLGDIVREYAPKGLPTSENAILPALGFLGGMLSSPNPRFLGALGSGLVSGVSTQFELDKLNEERVKNAYNLMKDRFVDSMQTDANGMPYLMKMDKDTNKLYTTDQMATIRANILKASGVSARSFEEMGRADQQPAKASTAVSQSAPAAAPKPGETKVAEGEVGAVGTATTPKKAADPIKAAAATMYPLPPEGLDQTEMSKAHLKSAAFWNPKEYSVAEDPMAIVANIQNLKARVKAWDEVGNPAAAETANKFRGQIDSETKRLDTILGEAVENIAERNKGIQAATVAKADKFGEEIKQRTEKYRTIRSQLLRLADLQAEGLNTGYGAEAVRNMVSLATTLSGGAIDMPFLSSLTNAGQFDYAAKIAAAQIVNGVKDAGLQRAPAAGLSTEKKITPSTEMSPGGIHQLLGQTLGEMDYVHERDRAFLENKTRWTDPSKFMDKYDREGGEKGGDYKYNKKVAEAFSQIPVPKKGGKDIPEVIDSLRRKYGETAEVDYGYRPKNQKDVAAPAAASGKSVVRSGTVNSGPNAGKKIIEYSDGTKEYQ